MRCRVNGTSSDSANLAGRSLPNRAAGLVVRVQVTPEADARSETGRPQHYAAGNGEPRPSRTVGAGRELGRHQQGEAASRRALCRPRVAHDRRWARRRTGWSHRLVIARIVAGTEDGRGGEGRDLREERPQSLGPRRRFDDRRGGMKVRHRSVGDPAVGIGDRQLERRPLRRDRHGLDRTSRRGRGGNAGARQLAGDLPSGPAPSPRRARRARSPQIARGRSG